MLQEKGILKCCACAELNSQGPRNVSTSPILGMASLEIQVRELNHMENNNPAVGNAAIPRWQHSDWICFTPGSRERVIKVRVKAAGDS